MGRSGPTTGPSTGSGAGTREGTGVTFPRVRGVVSLGPREVALTSAPHGPAWAGVVARLRAAGCVFAEDEADVLVSAARTPSELAAMVERRGDGLPLEHVVGWAQFCGLRIAVADGGFVPRHRSELLARTAAGLVDRPGAVVVDLCCGSGALGAVVAATARHPVRLYAADLDHAAVACARENLEPYGGLVLQGDLFDALP